MLAILAFAVVVWITEAVTYETSAIMITSLMAGLIGFAPTVADSTVNYGTSRAGHGAGRLLEHGARAGGGRRAASSRPR